MYTISQLAERFSVSRSTLIYYHKIALLVPSGRSNANYRLYSEADADKMVKICRYRSAGLSLEQISEIINQTDGQSLNSHLEQRLDQINYEINALRQQQQQIVSLLGQSSKLATTRLVDKAQWVRMLRACGMDEQAMRQWHIEFERNLPEAHTDFLQSLGISSTEIKKIKSWAEL